MTDFKFDSHTASAVVSAVLSLSQGVASLKTFVANLRGADGCGNFASGTVIQSSLQNLGDTANQMSVRLMEAINKYKQTVIDAGGLITEQEAENYRRIAKSDSGPTGGSWFDNLADGVVHPSAPMPVTIPSGPSPLDSLPLLNSNVGTSAIPPAAPDAAGKFPCPAAPEVVIGLTLDTCVSSLTSAQAGVLNMLGQQWQQLGADLSSAVTTFHNMVEARRQTNTWTGTSGPAVYNAATELTTTAVQISAQANANGAAVLSWATSLGDTKSAIDEIASSRTSTLASAPPESRVSVQNYSDMAARLKIAGTYNPAVTAIATGLSNLTDPSSPVAGVPLVIGGPPGPGSGGPGSGGSGASRATSGGGGGGGSTGGSASTASANKSATDAAKSLTRQGSGDPAAAASNASKNAAAQSGQGNPASAAQSAMSKAGDTAKGLGGKSGASPLTRSAGLGSMADAEKSAAAKAASALSKGGGAGGGGASGGGGIGKMGGAGIAAAEGSLSARSAAGLSAAERAMAAPQAAPATGRAGMGSGAPMGGARGGQGSENEKEHKSARYLISEENGEEIAGELPDTAPPVLGGLNLDTTDNPDTTR